MARREYGVIVVGGGHAGVEAAWGAANLLGGVRSVALVTLDPARIGVMSCNPAIGGLAKGQLVREVDALGGLMGLAADASGISFKVLNTSKGPAVHGPRCQSDKHAYAEAVRALVESRPEIEVLGAAVERLLVEETPGGRRIMGVRVLRRGVDGAPVGPEEELRASAVVLTTGTFMRGLMHTGDERTPGGRHGEAPATGISAALEGLGFELGRLKTGTPPRLRRGSIDWDALPAAPGDVEPVPFSELTSSGGGAWEGALGELGARFPMLEQVECRQTHTTASTHGLIRANLHRAPMYAGQIESAGPRYCPSIEDKVVRFAERERHGVFLEPESLRDDWVYCNGISTSLPRDVQDVLVRSMPGCERAEIYRYGYAVEYDVVRPHQIEATGMTKLVGGLYLAGQINGTSGYEEAAAQGVVAGVNAGLRALSRPEFVLGRDRAYIGVLMDDLITKTPVEPYRMFTSRAEHRLLLRADNAPDRLTPLAIELGLLDSTALGRRRRALFEHRRVALTGVLSSVENARLEGAPLGRAARRPGFAAEDLRRALGEPGVPRGVVETALAEVRYASYIVRQRAEIRRQAELERRRIPGWVDYRVFTSLRSEARESLDRFRPATFGQAGRLAGVTPADLTLLAVLIARGPRSGAEPAASV